MSVQDWAVGPKYYNPKDFVPAGITIGNGSYNPLSQKYASVPAAQVDYPRATSLLETFDWHAHAKTIDAMLAEGIGGRMVTVGGKYVMSDNSVPAPDALHLPVFNDRQVMPTPTTSNVEINWQGDGNNVTRLEWRVDKGTVGNLGSTDYAVMCGAQAGDPNSQQADSRYGSGVMCAGEIRDLTLVGPDFAALGENGSRAVGVAGSNMSGLCWGARKRLKNVRFAGWRAGHDYVGDHTHFEGLVYYGNYYDVYINHSSPTVYGDSSWGEKCKFESARMANFGIHYGGDLNKHSFANHCYFASAPYAFFKEATPGSLPTGFVEKTTVLSGVAMWMPMFENLGNGVLWDDNLTVNGALRAIIDGLVMYRPNFDPWDNSKKISGRDRNFISVAQMNGVKLEDVFEMFVTAFTRPAFEISTSIAGEVLIEGDMEAFIAACAANSPSAIMPVKPPSDIYARQVRMRHNRGSGQTIWDGRVHATFTGDTVNAGHFCGTKFNGVRPMKQDDITVVPVGIARAAAFPNNPGQSGTQSYTIVAEEGQHVPFTTSSPSNAATPQKVSTAYGGLTDASQDGDGRIVGYGSSQAGYLNFTKSIRTSLNPLDALNPIELVGTSSYTLSASGYGYTLIAGDRGKEKGFSHNGSKRVTVATVNAGGSGYTNGDVLTVSGGTSTVAAQLTVTGVSGGAITSVSISNSGAYTVNPSTPASVTGGTGTGATFNLTLALIPLVLTLPNSFPKDYKFKFFQYFTNPLQWVVQSGGTVNTEGGITAAEAQYHVYEARVVANVGGTAAEWLVAK